MSVGVHIKAGGFDRGLIGPMIEANPDLIVTVGDGRDLDIPLAFHGALGDACHTGFRAMAYEEEVQNAMSAYAEARAANNKALMDLYAPEAVAAQWLNRISLMVAPGETDPAKRLDILSKQYGFITWQLLNEQKGHKDYQMRLDKARIALGVKHKIRMGVCAWGWGQPEPEEWLPYLPVLEAVKAAGDYATVILHVYWGPGAEPDPNDKVIFMRWKVYEAFCRAHNLDQVVDKQTEFWEYGKDEKGWRWPGGPLPDRYIEQLFIGDSFSPHIRKAAYDCSTIPDDHGQPHWYSLQENFILQQKKPGQPEIKVRPIDLLLARIKVSKKTLPRQLGTTVPTPPIEEEPPVEPEPAAVVYENHFDSFEPRRFADGMGDIMIPPGFEVGYLTGKNYGSLHGELSPSRETGVLKPDSFIFHVMGRMNAWLRVVFPTTPGDLYRLTVDTSATVQKVTRSIGLSPDLRDDPAGLDRVSTTDPARGVIVKERFATGSSMAAFWQAFTDQPIRSDAKIHGMKIERVAVAPPPVDTGVGPAITIDNGIRYNLRLTPAALGDTNLLKGELPARTKVHRTGKRQNGYSQVEVELSLDDSGPAIDIVGWLLSSGLQPVQS